MKPRKPDETDASYIARLEAANNSLRDHNASLTKWAEAINRAVSILSCEGSTVFQAMAEKARVRSHPSVTKAVEMFDSISHPQWSEGERPFPINEWPIDWDFDGPDAWAGDADMSLNSPIAEAFDYFEHRMMSTSGTEREHMVELRDGLQRLLQARVEGIKEAAGFEPRQLTVPTTAHCKDMSKEELSDMVGAMGWMALDIAQDLHFASHMLRRDLRASAYRRACAACYELSDFAYRGRPEQIDIKVFGNVAPF